MATASSEWMDQHCYSLVAFYKHARLVEIAIVLISVSRTHWCIVSLTQLLRAIRASMGPLSISVSKWDYCNFAFVCFASADIGCRSPGSNRFQPKYLSPVATSGLFCSCLLLSFFRRISSHSEAILP